MLDAKQPSFIKKPTGVKRAHSKSIPKNESNTQTLTSSIDERTIWKMRWLVLIVISSGFLTSLVATIIITLITKSYLTLAISPSLVLIMRPIIRWLFPTREHNKA